MIQVKGLTKNFGTRIAIDHISFSANRGEILGILGPNGAGKTTTMRILAGFMPPSSGMATVAGFDVVEKSLEVRQHIGYLPETVALYPEMTVKDYLHFMADLREVNQPKDRVNEVIQKVHLQDRANGYIRKLSKGMRQRVGLAQALLNSPDVLILDEPTIGLDPAQIIDVRNLIREVGKQHTVLLSTHILSEVQQLCHRVIILSNGRIIAEDTPNRLQARVSGAQRGSVTVGGDVDGFEKVVESVSGVTSVVCTGHGSLEFEANPGKDLRPVIARALVTENYELLDIHLVTASLEDVFLQLTREDPIPPSTDDSDLLLEPVA